MKFYTASIKQRITYDGGDVYEGWQTICFSEDLDYVKDHLAEAIGAKEGNVVILEKRIYALESELVEK